MTEDEAQVEFARCRPWLEAALEYATSLTIDDVIAAIATGHMHFWPGKNCAVITEIAVYPRTQNLNVVLAGGDLEELIDMVPSLKSWAAFHGCGKVTLAGRPGWERALRGRGWKREFVVLSTPVEGLANGGKEPTRYH